MSDLPLNDYSPEIDAAIADLESATFEWAGKTYRCVPHSSRVGFDFPIGPPTNNSRWSLHVRRSLFKFHTADDAANVVVNDASPLADDYNIPPTKGKRIKFRQKDWEIDDVDWDGSEAYFVLHLVSPNS